MAATGTLVVDAAPVEQRLVSTLPPIHVALVGSSRLRADLPTVLRQLHPSQTGYISLITGPSRTADIERVLTIGVHGPERLVIVFVDEVESRGFLDPHERREVRGVDHTLQRRACPPGRGHRTPGQQQDQEHALELLAGWPGQGRNQTDYRPAPTGNQV